MAQTTLEYAIEARGRNVTYVGPDGRHFDAEVVNAHISTADLQLQGEPVNHQTASGAILRASSMTVLDASYSENKEPGTWHWKERV